jgi:hypothetical protein
MCWLNWTSSLVWRCFLKTFFIITFPEDLCHSSDGDRNTELSNANKSFADHRVTGDPPCSSPRRRATSTQILESTINHKPYFIKHLTGFCLLGFINDVLTTSLAEERANSRAEKRKCRKASSCSKIMGREEFLRQRSHGKCPQCW